MVDGEVIKARLVYIVVACLAALSILGSLFVFPAAEYPIFSPFLRDLGMAGFIALIIIFTIEKFTRERNNAAADRLIEKINGNLFRAIYRRYVPDEVFVEVEESLMFSSVFRTGHEVYYSIQVVDEPIDGIDCTKYVQCEARSNYMIKNLSDGPIHHDVVMTIERPLEEKLVNRCKILSVKIGKDNLSSDQILAATTLTDSQKVFRHAITLEKNEKIAIATSAALLKQKTDSEIWASRIPSDGITITVSVPGRDLAVNAHALHRQELEPIMNTPVLKKWALRYGMFPYQSVVFWWKAI